MTRKTRRTRLYMSVAALILPIAGLGLWQVSSHLSHKDDGISVVLKDSGYFELRPPSRLAGPGTINTVETLSDGSLRLHPTCTMDKDVLASLWQESDTVDRHLVTSVTNAFDAMADALSLIAAHATGNQVKKVAISFQNMRIVTISDENIYKLRGDYLKGGCEQAVIGNLHAGAKVCQTEEVLEADLVYRISFADDVDVDEKAKLAEELTGSVKLDVDNTSEDEMRGNDLYFGVKVGLKCLELDIPAKNVAMRS
jgi:hypothetical protein